MRAVWIFGVLGLSVSCGGGYEGDQAKTPADIVAEEERLAAEDDKERQAYSDAPADNEELDVDKKSKFDKRQAKLELQRASRSAATCPGTVEEKAPSPSITVTLTFANDGNVKDASVDGTYADTKIGTCVLRAMKAVIVPGYTGSEVQIPWTIEFVEGKGEK